MGAPKTVEVAAHGVREGNVVRFQAGKQFPDYLRVTGIEPVSEEDGTVKVEERDGKIVPVKVAITGKGHGAKWEDSEESFTMVVLGDLMVHVRLKRVRMVHLKNGESLEFVRSANIQMAKWLRARDINGRVRTVFLNEVLRKEWEYVPIV